MLNEITFKYMGRILLFFFISLSGLLCCCANDSLNMPDENLINFFTDLYKLSQDNPARFALNEIASQKTWKAINQLRGDLKSSENEIKQAKNYLLKLKHKIELGFNWPAKNLFAFKIPYTETPPIIDGKLNDNSWEKAFTATGCYNINSSSMLSDDSVWKILWDNKYLYIGVSFNDICIVNSYKENHPYLGDSLEIFIMPSFQLKDYWEIVIGLNGEHFDGLHHNNKWGGFIGGPEHNILGLVFNQKINSEGYCIEVAIPFNRLPNYQLGNTPKSGESIYFSLIRTDKNSANGKIKYYSSHPLLYSGHNIFGYAKGLLSTASHIK